MSVAVEQGRVDAMLRAVLAMVVMIVALDQLLWRPVVVWAQKFRLEEGGQQPQAHSWFLDRLRRSRLLTAAGDWLGALGRRLRVPRPAARPQGPSNTPGAGDRAAPWPSPPICARRPGVIG